MAIEGAGGERNADRRPDVEQQRHGRQACEQRQGMGDWFDKAPAQEKPDGDNDWNSDNHSVLHDEKSSSDAHPTTTAQPV
jgi:hypothetical protein